MKKFRIAAVIAAGLALAACSNEQSDSETDSESEPVASPVAQAPACTVQSVSDASVVEIAPGLASKTFSTGCGEAAVSGQVAVVHYTGWLLDTEAENQRGEKFDSSRDRDAPFSFPLGGGRVIKGWDQGVVGMTIGEIRELTIAPELAYGDREISVIPAGSTLVFEVELVELQSAPPQDPTVD